MADGGKAIREKARGRLKGEAEVKEPRKKVTVSLRRPLVSHLCAKGFAKTA